MNNGYKKTVFEWWYFHFISDLKFNLIVHPTDMYGVEKKSYVSLTLLESSGNSINFKQGFDLERTEMSGTGLRIENEMMHLEENEKEIKIKLLMKDIKADIIIRKYPELKSFGNHSVMLQDCVGNLNHNWMLVIPASYFAGTLRYHNKDIPLSGYAYHDHNWGNWLIQDCYECWQWGNFQGDGSAVTYYYLVGNNGREIKILHMLYRGMNVTVTDFDIKTDRDGRMKIHFDTEAGAFSLTVLGQNAFKAHRRAFGEKTISYARYSASGELHDCVKKNILQLEGINEKLEKDKI